MSDLLYGNSSLKLFPATYPWAWAMYIENMANHWTPLQIPMAPDVACWASDRLSEAERHMFQNVMAQLTTFDIQRGDETAEMLQPILMPPEIKHYLKRLTDEEALHTWSYQTCIENLHLDQAVIYSMHEQVQEMWDRVALANQLSDRVQVVYAKRVLDPEYEYTLEDRQALLLAMIFWFLIFEGIWFVVSLQGPIQNLARQGKMQATAEQFQYILRDEFQHIRFGVKLINEFIRQNADCITPEFHVDLADLIDYSIQLEEAYIKYCLPQPVLGYNADDHVLAAKHYANLRLRSIGFKECYPDAYNPFTWFDEMTMIRKEKNFFETHVTEYQTGSELKWD